MESITVAVLFLIISGVTAQYSWSYTGETGPGPAQWASRGFPFCAGSKQSPIDVPASPEYDDSLTAFQFHGYDALGDDDLEIVNFHGWTAKVAIKQSSYGKAYFTGGGIADKYVAAQLYFHWGKDDNGSEHTFQRHHYPLELHVVHIKETYHSSAIASQFNDGMAVLAFFFTISETDNEDLAPFFSALEHIKYRDEKHSFGTSFDKFMTNKTSEYYRYHGSMTHPPCREAITWSLFKHTNTISSAQLATFRQLHVTERNAGEPRLLFSSPLTFNHRPTQSLGTRKVKASFHTGSAAGTMQLTIFGLALSLMLSLLTL